MKQRSSHNWKTKSGTWDSLNIHFLNFEGDYPFLSSIFDINSFNIVTCNNYKKINENTLVSMFVDDYILERFWNNPLKYIKYFSKCKYVMSPDFSLLIGMPIPMQMWNVYRNRLVGHAWQSAGLKVIPTVSWSNMDSFDFCFQGIEYGSTVAISNIGCRNVEQKKYFDDGFYEMVRVINPMKIIFQCNNKFKEQYESENILFIDSFFDLKRKKAKQWAEGVVNQ